ncbi:hypothetical protein [Caballeronia sp. LZ001]|uniref:hypothetical protein n=1 Tax=Caballeronia sp. LZ001 TaxID=3038553 RepID=UPI0028563FFC|nr:hypothetical protein [Caballeronia sp. LZ001]MDR5803401.1 hypothetical protein [Caballeronia sp. LZ001]
MNHFTQCDSLEYGIEYPDGSGEYHFNFEIRLPTVDDNIKAYEHPSILGGGVSNMRVNVAILASCLLSLGSIPKDAITPELIGSAVDADYDKLVAVQEMIKKKRKAMKPASANSGESSSSSGSTA